MAGSRNITTQSLDQQLQQSLRRLWSEFLQLKNRQPIGADVLQVQSLPTSNTFLAFPGASQTTSLAAGAAYLVSFQWAPNDTTLTIWNFSHSVYLDPTSFNSSGVADNAHLYPTGGAIVGFFSKIQITSWLDWATSSDSTNVRTYMVLVINNDSVSHNVTINVKAYLPNLNQTTA